MTMFGYCEGDVTNLQGARLFERSQYIQPRRPVPASPDRRSSAPTTTGSTPSGSPTARTPTGTDAACGTSQPNNIRLSGGAAMTSPPAVGRSRADGRPGEGRPGDDVGVLPPLRRRRHRVRPLYDGRDQRRRHDAAAPRIRLPDLSRPARTHPVLRSPDDEATSPRPPSAPRRAPARDRQPARGERRSAPRSPGRVLATPISPQAASRRFRRRRRAASTGATWSRRTSHCRSSASAVSRPRSRAARSPPPARLGGQSGTRENALGQPLLRAAARARRGTSRPRSARASPAASGNVTGFKALALGAVVNFFDPRNPPRGSRRDLEPGFRRPRTSRSSSPTRTARSVRSPPPPRATARRCTRRPAPPPPPRPRGAQRDPRSAERFRRSGPRPRQPPQVRTQVRRPRACRPPGSDGARPTCASRRRPAARRSTPTSSPTSPPTAAPVARRATPAPFAAAAAPEAARRRRRPPGRRFDHPGRVRNRFGRHRRR